MVDFTEWLGGTMIFLVIATILMIMGETYFDMWVVVSICGLLSFILQYLLTKYIINMEKAKLEAKE